MKISFFQFLPKFNSLRDNIDSIKFLIKKNKKAISESELLVLPEYSFSGPLELKNFENYKKQLEEIDVKKEFEIISKELKKTFIVFGSIILSTQNKFSNLSLVYCNGKEIGSYSKKALIYNENYICKSNNDYLKVNIGDIKIGVAICWDLILPEVFRHYTGEVDIVVIPSFWGVGGNVLQSKYSFSLEKKYYRQLCTARAYENAFGILFVNSVGKYNSSFYSDRMMGGSLAVLPPLGEIYLTNNKKSHQLHVVDFDFKYLKQYRKYYATDKDYKFYKFKNIF